MNVSDLRLGGRCLKGCRRGMELVAVEVDDHTQHNDAYNADNNGGRYFVHFMLLLRLMLNFAAKVQQPRNTLSENCRKLPIIAEDFRLFPKNATRMSIKDGDKQKGLSDKTAK